MVNEISPSLAYHYWFICINGEITGTDIPLHGEIPTGGAVLVRGTDFDPNKAIGKEDDKGHTGTSTTKMSTYRSEATSEPQYKDRLRYKEGWEDILYLLTGSDDGTNAHAIDKTTVDTGVYKYVFSKNPLHPLEDAFATLHNGFGKTEDDAYLYLNALLNTFNLSGGNKDAPTYEAKFVSDFPHFHEDTISRTIPAKTIFPKSNNVRIFIAPQGVYDGIDAGTGVTNPIGAYEFSCYEDWSVEVNKNVEGKPCANDEFGTSTKVTGEEEGNFKITLPWNSKTKDLEYEFMGGDANATLVTDEDIHKTVWIVMKSGAIGETEYNYQTIFKINDLVLTNVNSPQSGEDAKTLDVEVDIVSNVTLSFVEAEVITDLEDLHIYNTPSQSSSP